MKTDFFQSRGHWWVFQICWHIECSTFTASSFRIWNSSTGIPSPPLALFIVMLPKAHLSSHSRMSDSRWVITPSWLSGSWRSFLYSSSVYFRASLISQWVKNPPAAQEPRFNSWVRKIPWRRNRLPTLVFLGFPCGSTGEEFACSVGDLGSISRLRRSPGEGKGYPLQYSSLENSIDCIVHGFAKTEPLSFYSVYFCHLFLISSASVSSTPFLSFIVPIIAWMFPWYL